jgi:hypothetical protein
MRVFLSWSGDVSRRVAEKLREWLPGVIQVLEPWMSSEDIGKGRQWNERLTTELEHSSFGIVCLTRQNVTSEWIHFEAGALARSIVGARERNRVSPFLFEMELSEVSEPLSQFQATRGSEEDVRRLMMDINGTLEKPLRAEALEANFALWWPKLERELSNLRGEMGDALDTDGDRLSMPDAVEGILSSVRALERSMLRLEHAQERRDAEARVTFGYSPLTSTVISGPIQPGVSNLSYTTAAGVPFTMSSGDDLHIRPRFLIADNLPSSQHNAEPDEAQANDPEDS